MLRPDNRSSYFESKAKHREKMINRIYKGVPDSVRGGLWQILLEIDIRKKEQEGVYERMRNIARLHSPDIKQVGDLSNFQSDSLIGLEKIIISRITNMRISNFWGQY